MELTKIMGTCISLCFINGAIAASLHDIDMRSAMMEISKQQSQCTSGEYLDIETSTCKSCDIFCENGLHLERCGLECQAYFNIRSLNMTIAMKDEALMNATEDENGYLETIKNKDIDILSLEKTVNALVIIICILCAILLGAGICMYVKYKCTRGKWNENLHTQAEDDLAESTC